MNNKDDTLTLFAVNASRDFGESVAQKLGIVPGEHEECPRNGDLWIDESIEPDPFGSFFLDDAQCPEEDR